MALREDAPDEAGALAGTVGHVLAWHGAGRTSAPAVEEDQEDERADESETPDHTDDNAGNRTATQTGAAAGDRGAGGFLGGGCTGR